MIPDGFPAADRTFADLAGKQEIGGNEVVEAIQSRALDRRLFEKGCGYAWVTAVPGFGIRMESTRNKSGFPQKKIVHPAWLRRCSLRRSSDRTL